MPRLTSSALSLQLTLFTTTAGDNLEHIITEYSQHFRSKICDSQLFAHVFFGKSTKLFPRCLSMLVSFEDLFSLEIHEHSELPVGDRWDLAPIGLRVVVEVPRVALEADLGHDGRLQLLVVHLLPVHTLEPSKKMVIHLYFKQHTFSADYFPKIAV